MPDEGEPIAAAGAGHVDDPRLVVVSQLEALTMALQGISYSLAQINDRLAGWDEVYEIKTGARAGQKVHQLKMSASVYSR